MAFGLSAFEAFESLGRGGRGGCEFRADEPGFG